MAESAENTRLQQLPMEVLDEVLGLAYPQLYDRENRKLVEQLAVDPATESKVRNAALNFLEERPVLEGNAGITDRMAAHQNGTARPRLRQLNIGEGPPLDFGKLQALIRLEPLIESLGIHCAHLTRDAVFPNAINTPDDARLPHVVHVEIYADQDCQTLRRLRKTGRRRCHSAFEVEKAGSLMLLTPNVSSLTLRNVHAFFSNRLEVHADVESQLRLHHILPRLRSLHMDNCSLATSALERIFNMIARLTSCRFTSQNNFRVCRANSGEVFPYLEVTESIAQLTKHSDHLEELEMTQNTHESNLGYELIRLNPNLASFHALRRLTVNISMFSDLPHPRAITVLIPKELHELTLVKRASSSVHRQALRNLIVSVTDGEHPDLTNIRVVTRPPADAANEITREYPILSADDDSRDTLTVVAGPSDFFN